MTEPKTFTGKPCRHCGGTERLISTRRCRPCSNNWVRQSIANAPERAQRIGEPCGICHRPMDPPCLDHKPGAHQRGWLCHECNKGIGWLNSCDLLVAALAYMAGWGNLPG